MRIAELAKIAGVSVRTLRYYHQVGALEEPPRLSNWYRDYSVDHLVKVLRIVQLTNSGLAVTQAGEIAADPAGKSNEEVLDTVDEALADQITLLTHRREQLAQARSGNHVGLTKAAAALVLEPQDIPAATVLAHLYKDTPEFEVFTQNLNSPEARSIMAELDRRFKELSASSTPAEVEDVLRRTQEVVDRFEHEIPNLAPHQSRLVLEIIDAELNETQAEIIRRFYTG